MNRPLFNGYRDASGREVRLGSVQRKHLQSCVDAPQRGGVGSPPFKRLMAEGFVTSTQHVSARTGRPTLDRLYTITDAGRRYLTMGRDR